MEGLEAEELGAVLRREGLHDGHEGRDVALLTARKTVYANARARTTRNWSPITIVCLNPSVAMGVLCIDNTSDNSFDTHRPVTNWLAKYKVQGCWHER